MKSHKDLTVWQNSIELVTEIYKITQSFPREEAYGLQGQMRRAAISIASNISEGASRVSSKDFVQFLHVSLGSASELETQVIIAEKIGYLTCADPILLEINSIKKMLLGLVAYLKKHPKKQ